MPLKSFSTAPVSTCSSACDGRYGAKHREQNSETLQCSFLLNLLNDPEVARKTKMTGLSSPGFEKTTH